ncbi:uncharacterized protein LOC110987483 isoform X1 [Acanthaster planci]|uniref:Uncharacterized protein LOC110987483 isoform X1 n=1 Tax=Acanthaster planci TaxID=133434 RepID=A0A8B7ZR73_ACAPL|nr:uncharacterized protein LOC110987483 isoform X1 [Acanthaster planci]
MALWVILAIVYLQTSIDSIQAVCTPCPFQWTESQSNCYRYFEASLSYRDAVEYCQHFSRPARIASLATVTSFNELLFMSKFVDDIFKNAFAPDVPSLIWLTINSRNTSELELPPILHQSFNKESDVIPCGDNLINNETYQVGGNESAVSVVPGPERLDQTCAVHVPVESFIDLGDFSRSCISDLDSCHSHSATWTIWLKIDTPPRNSSYRGYYLSSGGQTQSARGIVFLYNAGSCQFQFMARSQKHVISRNYTKGKVPLDKWFHLTFTVNSIGMPSMDLKVYVDGELIQADDMSDAITEGGRSDDFTRLYLGMTNTCTGKYPVSQYGGSAAYSSLVVFDGLLGIQEIRHLYECRSIGKLVNIATVDHATIGPTLLATDDTEHQFNMDDENTDIFYNTPPATDGSPTTGPRLELQENPFICQL